MNYKEFFARRMNAELGITHLHDFEQIPSTNLEDLYQAFKARMIAEQLIDSQERRMRSIEAAAISVEGMVVQDEDDALPKDV